MPLVCVSAMSNSLVSYLPIPLVSFPLLVRWVRILPRLTGEFQKHSFPTPSPLTQWPVGSLGQLESKFSSHSLLSLYPTSTALYTPLLSQDWGRRGKIRLKWFRGLSHAWRLMLGGPCSWMERLPPPPTTSRKFADLRMKPPPSLTFHLASSLRQDSLMVPLGFVSSEI